MFLDLRVRDIDVREKHRSVVPHKCPDAGLNMQPRVCTLIRNQTHNLLVLQQLSHPAGANTK